MYREITAPHDGDSNGNVEQEMEIGGLCKVTLASDSMNNAQLTCMHSTYFGLFGTPGDSHTL